MSAGDEGPKSCLGRRGALAGGVFLLAGAEATAQSAPGRSKRPQKGDRLVHLSGPSAGMPVTPDDLVLGGPQVMAWALDPADGTVRDGSRLNQVLLVRLNEETLAGPTRERAVGGVVAYSAICTHAQCPVTEFRPDVAILHCPCHNSEFDPANGCKVTNGPATRSLAALPIALVEGVLTVADPFIGRVGMVPA